jgi:multiple sugar transport system substrate-binding protein
MHPVRPRFAIRALLLTALLSLVGLPPITPSQAANSPPFNWQQFQGTTLHVFLADSHWVQVMGRHFTEFEALTGIKLVPEVKTQAELWDLLETALPEPGRVDVFMTAPGLVGLRYLKAGWIHPVNDYLRDSRLTSPDYDWGDFLPQARNAMTVDGNVLGPPVMGEDLALIYRKDLFAKYKLAVPRTLDELDAAARLLHKKPMDEKGNPGVAVVCRGQGPFATSIYSGFLHALGASWFDAEGRPTINEPKGLAALERMGNLLNGYAPPDTYKFGWQEASTLFVNGGAAMYIEGSSIYPLIEQSRKSQVAGKVGYAIFPGGPGGPGTSMVALGLAIARQSANPDAAWLFLQWASSKEMVKEALRRGVLVGRKSAWQDPDANWEVPSDLAQSLQEAGRIGVVEYAPPMVAITAARIALGKAITAAIRGEGIRAAADTAAAELTDILRQTGGQAASTSRPTP